MSKYCTRCGHIGKPQRNTPGSFLIEVILWLCFLVPGIIYSLWRLSARHDVCHECGSREIVPLTSPIARKQVSADPALQQLVGANEANKHKLSPRTKIGLVFVGSMAVLIMFGFILDAVSKVLPN